MHPIAQILIGIMLGTLALFGLQKNGLLLPASESNTKENQQEIIVGWNVENYLTCALFMDGNSKELFLLNGDFAYGTRLSNHNKEECQNIGGVVIDITDINKFEENRRASINDKN